MIRLVDDLLELSRISRGKIDLRMEDLDIRRVIEAAVETSRPLIEKAAHKFRMRVSDEDLCVRGDPVRLAQVLSNLLNNAARYTDDGGEILLEAYSEPGEAVVAVSDNGRGLSEAALTGVFDMFIQADAGDTRAQHGLGIGLALVRNLVEMHGGVVNASSAGVGLGARFEIRLPLLPHARQTRHVAAPTPMTRLARRILVVDDNRDAAETLANLLGQVGATVQVAYNGPEALNGVERFHPEIVILDLGMPGMSGLDVARQIRKRPDNDCKLVALTGWGQSADRELTRAAGFAHHLTKPADFAEMHALLSSL
jgi:CheY-like chemotaxis protein